MNRQPSLAATAPAHIPGRELRIGALLAQLDADMAISKLVPPGLFHLLHRASPLMYRINLDVLCRDYLNGAGLPTHLLKHWGSLVMASHQPAIFDLHVELIGRL